MEVLIAGSGNMARGIGGRMCAGKHRVRIADREPSKAVTLARELEHESTGEAFESVGDADIVVLATPYRGSLEVARRWADQLAGKVLIDICNPVDTATYDRLVTPPDKSAAEEIAEIAPDALVVKAFNTTFATRLSAYGALDVFIAGDEEKARGRVARVCEDGGLRPIQVGALKHARALEAFQLLHMKVQDQIRGNWSTALAIEY
ncbi:NAD(P)-binding domain-containing protein [Glycomyces sp. L485]|uniref:NADPH-dependent F420 reductase n=1 Tax=Glycomyces sp. L485 TaxID=2909235 RepID=UPI001F4B2645|nr:NAD(P)-binding domain-containing protein [Glycomyces sp. L485]MCH7230096.1 NAD(P)-binding domain-containing protein [Glycomyces sp. L485]